MSATDFHPLRISQVQPEGDDALVLAFDVPVEWRTAYAFEPGQYLTLRHGDERPAPLLPRQVLRLPDERL